MSNEDFDQEQVYDEQIAPLMAQIIGICREHSIPFLASFNYARRGGENMLCTSSHADTHDMPENMKAAFGLIRHGFSALAVTARSGK